MKDEIPYISSRCCFLRVSSSATLMSAFDEHARDAAEAGGSEDSASTRREEGRSRRFSRGGTSVFDDSILILEGEAPLPS